MRGLSPFSPTFPPLTPQNPRCVNQRNTFLLSTSMSTRIRGMKKMAVTLRYKTTDEKKREGKIKLISRLFIYFMVEKFNHENLPNKNQGFCHWFLFEYEYLNLNELLNWSLFLTLPHSLSLPPSLSLSLSLSLYIYIYISLLIRFNLLFITFSFLCFALIAHQPWQVI